MTPEVELDELVTGAEIGRRLSISGQRVHQLAASDPDFPKPLGKVGQATIWRWPDVEAWSKKPRPSGRPPASES